MGLRAPRLLAPFALALLVACASSGAPPAPPSATPTGPAGPATYAFFFEYEPLLTLGVQRDGAPIEGPATLRIQFEEEHPDRDPEAEFHMESVVPKEEPIPLVFHQGKAQLPADRLSVMSEAPILRLVLGETTLDVPRSRGAGPLRCGVAIHGLQQIDACAQPLPSGELVPEDCDGRGARVWLERLDRQQERLDGCFADLSDATLGRLAGAQALRDQVCPRLLALAGPTPTEEQALRLAPSCLNHFPAPLRHRTERAQALQELPAALASARVADSPRMQTFYNKYRKIDPFQAEEIRKLAAERFGPKDPARWLALRDAIEAIKVPRFRFTLCDQSDSDVQVAWSTGAPPRYSQSPPTSIPELSEPLRQPVTLAFAVVVPLDDEQRNRPTSQQLRLVEAVVSKSVPRAKVSFVRSCIRGRHWYFASEPAATR
jgi:hypothetical protein